MLKKHIHLQLDNMIVMYVNIGDTGTLALRSVLIFDQMAPIQAPALVPRYCVNGYLDRYRSEFSRAVEGRKTQLCPGGIYIRTAPKEW